MVLRRIPPKVLSFAGQVASLRPPAHPSFLGLPAHPERHRHQALQLNRAVSTVGRSAGATGRWISLPAEASDTFGSRSAEGLRNSGGGAAVAVDDKAGGRLGLYRAVAVVVGGYLDIDVVGATVRVGVFDLNVGVVDLPVVVDGEPEIPGGLDPLDVGGRLTVSRPGGLAPFGHDDLQLGIDPDAADSGLVGEEALDLLPPFGRPRCRGRVRRA